VRVEFHFPQASSLVPAAGEISLARGTPDQWVVRTDFWRLGPVRRGRWCALQGSEDILPVCWASCLPPLARVGWSTVFFTRPPSWGLGLVLRPAFFQPAAAIRSGCGRTLEWPFAARAAGLARNPGSKILVRDAAVSGVRQGSRRGWSSTCRALGGRNEPCGPDWPGPSAQRGSRDYLRSAAFGERVDPAAALDGRPAAAMGVGSRACAGTGHRGHPASDSAALICPGWRAFSRRGRGVYWEGPNWTTSLIQAVFARRRSRPHGSLIGLAHAFLDDPSEPPID
jgi:hypothetical protein